MIEDDLGWIGPYSLLAELARGGMGVVYRARDAKLNRPVAVKLLHAPKSEKQRKRFQREGQALAKLQHRNVVRVYVVGEHKGAPYLVMDLIEGASLQERLDAEGPSPPEEAARITLKLANAIEFAHDLGILHRDIKPANVLVREGEPLLTDFGLAGKLDKDGSVSTRGTFMGTPGYAPPEQAQGQLGRIGPSSDVYGLGALLYALLTGRPPVEADSLVEAIVATAERAPTPPSELGVKLSPDLESVCLRCLEKDPDARYVSAWGVARDLELCLANKPLARRSGPADSAGRAELPPVLVLGAVSVLLLVLGAGVAAGLLNLLRSETPAPVASASPTETAPKPTGTSDPALQALEQELARLDQATHRPDPYQPLLERKLIALLSRAWGHDAVVEQIRRVLVSYLVRRERLPKAIDHLTTFQTTGPLSMRLRLLRAVADANQRITQRRGSETSFDRIRRLWDEHPERVEGVAAGVLVSSSEGRFDRAIQLAREVLQRDPTLACVRFPLIHSLQARRRLDEALREAEAYARSSPDDCRAWLALGTVQSGQDDFTAAIRSFDRGLALQSPSPVAYYLVAQVMLAVNDKRWERVGPLADQGRRLHPQHIEFDLAEGLAEYAQGRKSEALELWRRGHGQGAPAFERALRGRMSKESADQVMKWIRKKP